MSNLSLQTLFLLDLACLAVYWPLMFRKSRAKSITGEYCFKSAVCFFGLAWFMVLLPPFPPYFFHLIMCLAGLWWSYSMVKYCSAVYPALAIAAMSVLQIMFSVDFYVYGATPTGLGEYFAVIAYSIHAIIIMATYTNGLTIHASTEYHGTIRSKVT